MLRSTLIVVSTILMSAPQVIAQTSTDESEPVAGLVPAVPAETVSPSILQTEIADADPEQIFAVHLVFDSPVTVEQLQETALQLRIPRVLAYVEFGPAFVDRARNFLILGLGEMYSSEVASRHTRCRALISIGYGNENELRNRPIEEWTAAKIHVYAAAHAVRELLSGSLLPAANVLDGASAKQEHVQKVAAYTRDEVSRKIEIPGNVKAPEPCHQDVAPEDAPILTAAFDPSLRELPRLKNEGFREYAFRVLSILPPDSIVTIRLKLDFPATVDVLASLVWQYQIDGMLAELVPEHSKKQMIADAELSIHGAELGDQVRRARCSMRFGNGPHVTSEWYADWINVSLPATKAWVFLSYLHLSQAEIDGRFPPGDLDRLVSYYERSAQVVHEIPESIEIPSGCADLYKRI